MISTRQQQLQPSYINIYRVNMSGEKKELIKALNGEETNWIPCWLMRQSGRYLTEYKTLRRKTPNFIEFCLTPEIAAEATFIPLKRYNLDAAIIFSDILTIPNALGQNVSFSESIGPVLEEIPETLNIDHKKLEPVYEAIKLVKKGIDSQKAMIGFAGAPWTLASYMIEQGTSKTHSKVKYFALKEPQKFKKLMDVLESAISEHLIKQIEAGSDVVQMFDSWAGSVPQMQIKDWVIDPTKRIVDKVKSKHPEIPFIGFPRGIGANYIDFSAQTGVDAVSLDHSIPLQWAVKNINPKVTLQGALDPYTLVAGGEILKQQIKEQVQILKQRPYVFNLGHGIVPETPPENVDILLETLHKEAS